MGMDCRHDLARVILAARDKFFIFLPDNLFLTLATNSAYNFFFILPRIIGEPKYFPKLCVMP
ncbi:hypothetical protein Scep_010255 [Stephania cephalantha]|uniref:Uncharacterized protein n=1 Tax=Stephania cephalantha TaxID=152367 RepID=A0AAP0PF12_9MAGN